MIYCYNIYVLLLISIYVLQIQVIESVSFKCKSRSRIKGYYVIIFCKNTLIFPKKQTKKYIFYTLPVSFNKNDISARIFKKNYEEKLFSERKNAKAQRFF